MKKILLSSAFVFALFSTSTTFAQQGFGTNEPDKSSAVDIVSSKRGLLIPRVNLTSTTLASPITEPADALLVYNKKTEGDVTPGFYYWDGTNKKWVRFTSTATEKTVEVVDGNNTTVNKTVAGNVTTYSVDVEPTSIDINTFNNTLNVTKITPGALDQFLVTKENANGELEATWADADALSDLLVNAENGLTKEGNNIELGGTLNRFTEIKVGNNDFAISGLTDVSSSFDATSHKIVVMGDDGILKVTSAASLVNTAIDDEVLEGKALTSSDLDISTNGATALLKDVTVNIKEGAVTADKLSAGTGNEGKVATAQADGTVVYQDINTSSLAEKKTLSTDGVIVIGADENATDTEALDALLADVKLNIGKDKITADHIAENAITNSELADDAVDTLNIIDKAVTADKLNAGTGNEGKVAVAAADGSVSFENVAAQNIDGKDVTTTSSAIVLTNNDGAALTAMTIDLDMAALQIEANQINGGTQGQVMVVGAGDKGSWVDAATLGNTVTANNGLTKTANNIQLGGELEVAETIIVASKDNTLVIKGLQAAEDSNNLVVAEEDGTLRTVERSQSFSTAAATFNVEAQTGYNKFTQEIVILANIASNDVTITLPSATEAKGQVISVKVATEEESDFYVNINGVDGANVYGGMPYQGWIIKSNGTTWSIVGRY